MKLIHNMHNTLANFGVGKVAEGILSKCTSEQYHLVVAAPKLCDLIVWIWHNFRKGLSFSGDETSIESTVRSFDQKEVRLVFGKKMYIVLRKLILLSDLRPGQTIVVNLKQTDLDAIKSVSALKKIISILSCHKKLTSLNYSLKLSLLGLKNPTTIEKLWWNGGVCAKLPELSGPVVSIAYKLSWEREYLDLTELARLRWIEHWKIERLADFFDISPFAVKERLRRIRANSSLAGFTR